MHIVQFWRILWARRLMVVATTISCLLGGFALAKLLPPRYESHARVMLGLLKPDPVTGQTVGGAAAGAYVATQIELITDFNVAGKVVDALGWATDPILLSQYEHRSKKDQRDFQHWVSQRVSDNTTAKLLDSSNILEITYRANNPKDAKAVDEVLERAYLDTSLSLRRNDATRQAEWFEQQAGKARDELTKAQDAKAVYERANGVMMQDDKQDIESARLQVLSQQGVAAATATMPVTPQSSSTVMELAQTDALISEQSKILGPNHPDLLALKAKRASLAALATKDQQHQEVLASANARALNAAFDAQKNNVMAKSDKLERLKQLQSEVNLRREQYDKLMAAAADYRQQAAVANTGISVLGPATTPSAPSFPNMLLILPGSLALGLVFGILLSILLELLAWRVRGPEDMNALDDARLLAVIPATRGRRRLTGEASATAPARARPDRQALASA
jgi:succinoglycan biosynthesis transport protein ExoP